jgi:hypothetical protein
MKKLIPVIMLLALGLSSCVKTVTRSELLTPTLSTAVDHTELTDMTVRHFPVADPEKQQVFYQSDSLLYQLDVSADGNEVLATDNLGFYRLHGDGSGACASSEYVDSAGCVYYPWVIVLWAFLIVSGLIFAALAARMLYWIVISVISNENSMRVMLIILTCLAVFFILSYMLLSRLLDASTTASEKQTSLFSELLMLELEEGHILMAFGSNDAMTAFRQRATEAYPQAKTLYEEAIVG